MWNGMENIIGENIEIRKNHDFSKVEYFYIHVQLLGADMRQ